MWDSTICVDRSEVTIFHSAKGFKVGIEARGFKVGNETLMFKSVI